jgi:hypothetical protein
VKVLSVGSFRSPSARCGRRGQGRSSLPARLAPSQGPDSAATGYGAGGGTGSAGGVSGRITGGGWGGGGTTSTDTGGVGIDALPVSITWPVVGSTW